MEGSDADRNPSVPPHPKGLSTLHPWLSRQMADRGWSNPFRPASCPKGDKGLPGPGMEGAASRRGCAVPQELSLPLSLLRGRGLLPNLTRETEAQLAISAGWHSTRTVPRMRPVPVPPRPPAEARREQAGMGDCQSQGGGHGQQTDGASGTVLRAPHHRAAHLSSPSSGRTR